MKKKTLKLVAPILAIATIGLPIQQAVNLTHAHDLSVKTIHVENYHASAASEIPVFSNEVKAIRYLRDQLKQRSESITLNYAFSSDDYNEVSALLESFISKAEDYTGIDDEGDYIIYNMYSWNMSGTASYKDDKWNGKYIYTITYLKADGDTAAAEEAAVTNKVNEVYDSLQLEGKSSYEKLKAIHDYIIDNVEYDFDNYENDTYLVKHATYSAAITGKTVCQGYATYFYRLANKAGIECRVVDGFGNRGAHAWNLVKLDGNYYYVDATWDDGNYDKYAYFLKGSDYFDQDHTMSDASQKRFKDYNISKTDYDANTITAHTHHYVTTIKREPTCLNEGLSVKTCTICHDEQMIILPKTTHQWTLEASVEPTEEKEGSKTYKCSVCGETKTEVIPKMTHVHQWNKDYTVDVEPTCTTEGKKSIHCVKDDAIKPDSTVIIPAKGHDWVLTNTLPATEEKEGSKTYKCSICGETKTEVIPKVSKAVWMKNQYGWWYRNVDGSYPSKQWMKIDDIWYYFDAKGYMVTNWQKINNKWYFFDTSGAMITGWKKSSNKWYYLDDQGAMVSNKWEKIDGKWYVFDNTGVMKSSTWVGDYYVDASGAMKTNAWVGNYYVGSNGAYVKDRWIGKYHVNKNGIWDKTAGWQKNSHGWWYLNTDWTVPKNNWKNIEGKWYYFNESGYMMTGWQKLGDSWYYLGTDGAMKTGWQQISGEWYYFNNSGKMTANEYVDGYWVNSNGVWSR